MTADKNMSTPLMGQIFNPIGIARCGFEYNCEIAISNGIAQLDIPLKAELLAHFANCIMENLGIEIIGPD